jgi:cell division protease FtsH
MSGELGPMTYGEREEMVFLGRSIAEHRNYSEAIARKIDSEVRQIIGRAYNSAIEVMTNHRDLLDELARLLIENETLGEKEVEALLAGATG